MHNGSLPHAGPNTRATKHLFSSKASSLFWLVTVLFVLSRGWHLAYYDLWFDEIFSVHVAKQSVPDLLALTVRDLVHPPFFYLALKIWVFIVGESVLWLRLFPALTAIAAIIPFYFFCRELDLHPTEINLALILLAVNGYLIYYSQELRMYSLLQFLSLASLFLFVRFMNRGGDRISLVWLFAVNLILIYTHYYAWFVVGAEAIAILTRGRKKFAPFILSLVALILCFSPWAYFVARTITPTGLTTHLGWIGRPNFWSLRDLYFTLNGDTGFRHSTSLQLLLFGFPVLLWALQLIKQKDKREAFTFSWLILLSLFPTTLAFLLSLKSSQSIWGARHLIIIGAPYMILVACSAQRLRPAWLRPTMFILIAGWSALAGWREISRTDKKTDWQSLVNQMITTEPSETTGIQVYAANWSSTLPLRFYLKLAGDSRFEVLKVEDVATLDGDHFWVIYDQIGWKGERAPERILQDKGYQVGECYRAQSRDFKILLFPVYRGHE